MYKPAASRYSLPAGCLGELAMIASLYRLSMSVLAACALLQPAAVLAQARGAPEKAQIKVGIIPIASMTPLYVAQKLGFFRDEGLTVETTTGSSGSALASALIGGSLDIIFIAHVSLVQAAAEGFDLMIIANVESAQENPRARWTRPSWWSPSSR
jgi:NitT/TauT family transport system substrate-binding protein